MGSSREIDIIIIHCADTPDGSRRYTARDVDAWHAERGFRRKEYDLHYAPSFPYAGYHRIIETDGKIVDTRDYSEVGVHAGGYNRRSIGWCLMGRSKYTKSQWEALSWIIADAWERFGGGIQIVGHRDVNEKKSCPGFDVADYISSGLIPDPSHVL